MISVFAPARVDLSPGFTDVEPFCVEQPGLVLNVALDLGVEVTVGDGEDAALAPFVRRLREAALRRLGVDRADVRVAVPALPSGSGLGMSGALSVALACALSLHAGERLTPDELAALACHAERDTGLAGGTQDQLASVHGGAGLVTRHRDIGRRVAIDADLAELGARLVLVRGGGSRNSGHIVEQVIEDRFGTARPIIAAINQLSARMADTLRDRDLAALAQQMTQSTYLLRELHPDIVGHGIDQWLLASGADAAKPCGAGGPGAVWAVLVDPVSRPRFTSAVADAGWSVLPAAPSPSGVVRLAAR